MYRRLTLSLEKGPARHFERNEHFGAKMKLSVGVYYWALVVATALLAGVAGLESISDDLVKEVLANYEPDVRPICGAYPSPVSSTLGIAVRQLVEISEPEQKMSTSIWFRMRWSDCRLAWNVSDFSGIQRVILPKHRIWAPDLTLYDNAESKLGEQDEYRVIVENTGGVSYQLPAIVVSMCSLNVAHFPFDVQTCHLTLGSWTYNTNELRLYARSENPADLDTYIPHGEWDLFELEPVNQSIPSYDGTTYSQVRFTFYLRRRPLFHIVSLILPSIIVKALAVVGFILPPESGEKLNLSVTTLLSLLVFQLVILETMPHTSENMPILAIYFVLAMILIALSCVSTVFILNVHFSKHHAPLPMWLRKLLTSRLGWLFRVDHLIITAHEKYQRLQAEYSHYRPRQSQPQQCTSPSHKNMKRQPSYRTKSFMSRLPLSARGRKSSPDEDDSIYGFYPSNGHVNLTGMRPPAGHEYSADGSKPRTISTSFFTMNPDSGLRESDPKPGDSPALAITRRILSQLEKVNAFEMKKYLSDLQEQEWNIFAVFLDRVFLLLFLILGACMAVSVYCMIST